MPEYPGYQIGNQGTILGLYGRPLTPNIRNGYLTVYIGDVNYKQLVSRLVAKAFIPNPENKRCVDHINRIRTDNRLCNLQWATDIENCNNRGISYNNKYGVNGLSFNKTVGLWYARRTIRHIQYQKTFHHRSDAELYLQQISTIQL